MSRNNFLCGMAVFFTALFVYANSVTPTFHWEDEYLVRDNVHIRSLKNIPVFFRPGYINVYESGAGQRYRPLRTVSLALDYAAWGADPRGYHLTNVLLHASVSAAVWGLCLSVSGSGPAALLAGLLFALHPVHTESVAWVKNRSDILCALFYFLSALFFSLYLKGRGRLMLLGAALAAVPAFLAKEMAATLPVFMGLMLFKERGGGLKDWRSWLPLLPFLLIGAAYFGFRQAAMSAGPDFAAGLAARALLIINTMGEYLKLLVFPLRLVVDRPLPADWLSAALNSLLLAGSLSLAPYLYLSGRREGAFWLTVFFLTASPVSNLAYIPGRPLAEQRLYLPSAAFCAFAGWWLSGLLAGNSVLARRAGLGLAAGVLLFFGARTVARNYDWRDEIALWGKTVKEAPSPRAHNNLAVVLLRAKRYADAVENAGKSLEADPTFVDAYNTLGAAYHDMGLYDRSIAAFEKAVFFSNGRAYKSLMNLATLYGLKGRGEEAVSIYRRVIKMAPWLDTAHYNMGVALEKSGRREEALVPLAEAVALNPYNAHAYFLLGKIHAARGEAAAAAAAYSSLLRIDPANAEAAAYLAARRSAVDTSRTAP